MDGLQEIKDYFNKQNDWSTTTELEYFKWLIEQAENTEQEILNLKNIIISLRKSNREYNELLDHQDKQIESLQQDVARKLNVNSRLRDENQKSSAVVDKLSDKVWELEQQRKEYERILTAIGQIEDDKGNHLRANNSIGVININGRGTRSIR